MADPAGSTGWFTQASLLRHARDVPEPPSSPVVPPPCGRFTLSSAGDRHRIRFTGPTGGVIDGLTASDLRRLKAALDAYLAALPDAG